MKFHFKDSLGVENSLQTDKIGRNDTIYPNFDAYRNFTSQLTSKTRSHI